ncbi:MAG: lysophospholipid acyltransferase family protein [Polyangiaceae bacterium]
MPDERDSSYALERIGDVSQTVSPFFKKVATTVDSAVDAWLRTTLGEDFATRIERVPLALAATGVDPFGFDPEWAKYAMASIAFLHRHYFRTSVFGADNVPNGRVLLIANHSGQVPIDGALIAASLFMDAEPPRVVRAMVEKWTQTLPFVSTFFSRVGQVVGVPENARRLLEQGEALLVFPEGARGIAKTIDRRYQLEPFGPGFMRLAIETNTPIVPVAVIGGEEQYVSVANLRGVARLFRVPAFPIMPQIFVPGGQLPLPTKYRIYFGKPLSFKGDPDDDDAIIDEKVATVKAAVQSMVNRGVKERKNIFW